MRASSEDADSNAPGEVTFLPLRQVLDGRIKRRIRRNGLSEEMNTITAEKKRRQREAKDEIGRLKAALAEKDEEIRKLQDETVIMDTERVWDLEQQVEKLKQQLADRSGVDETRFDWTVAAHDPFNPDEYMEEDTVENTVEETVEDMDVDVEVFGEASMAELACSTPTRRARASFPTPPTTSPAAAPLTPCSGTRFTQPTNHAGVQASLPDPRTQELEDELASLHLELAKLTATLESYTSLTTRLTTTLAPFSPSSPLPPTTASCPHPEIEAHLTTLLQTLSDRTTALITLNSSISDLGFPGSDASSILASIRTAFRTARLELEYLTPGEISLPLTSSGAAVLDLLLDRLRDMSKRCKEADDTIDEYHALELSLRQQLSTRLDVTDGLRREVAALKHAVGEKDDRLAEQSVGLERLKGAVESYARDVRELEGLVERLEGELVEAEGRVVDKMEVEERLVARTAALEGQIEELRTAYAQTLEDLRRSHKDEMEGRNREAGRALAMRDARVTELKEEIERVNKALRAAQETVRKLRVENTQVKNVNEVLKKENEGLAGDVEEERKKAMEVVETMRAELERVVKRSEGLLNTPRTVGKKASRRDSALGEEEGREEEVSLVDTPSTSKRSSLDSRDSAKRGHARKRRRYDSGLGFLDEEEVDA